jgi:hypothetical protein
MLVFSRAKLGCFLFGIWECLCITKKKLANIDWRDMEDKVEKKLLAGRLA